MGNYVLKLFITGQTPRSRKAITNLQYLCETHLCGQYELAIIDVLEQPQMAELEKIIATPTLIKALPPPAKRIIGDLSDRDQVAWELDININHTNNGEKHHGK